MMGMGTYTRAALSDFAARMLHKLAMISLRNHGRRMDVGILVHMLSAGV